MATNKYKEIPEEPQDQFEPSKLPPIEQEEQAKKEEATPRKSKKPKNFFQFISFLDIVDKNKVVHAMPYILFLTAIAMFYITNSFYAERTIRQIDQTKRDLKEKRAEFISTTSKLMLNSMQSEVAQHAASDGIDVKESTVPPKKIVISGKKN
jgi:hypothetical protein